MFPFRFVSNNKNQRLKGWIKTILCLIKLSDFECCDLGQRIELSKTFYLAKLRHHNFLAIIDTY